MRTFLEISRTGLVAILLHPLRSLATIAALVVVLAPYLAGLGLSRGIEQQAEDSIRFGADLYVTARWLGRDGPLPVAAVEEIRKLEGVTDVVPRIVGRIVLGKNSQEAILVGVPVERFPPALACVEGRLYNGSRLNELVIGTELARHLHLEVGSLLPPFYHNAKGERLSQVVGLFKSDVPIWQANLVVTSFATAAAIFDQEGLATDLLVSCRPGYQDAVRAAIVDTVSVRPPGGNDVLSLRVTTRDDLKALLPAGLLHREGIFNLHFLLAFTLAILVILVTSGFGLSERRREIGILKATGWQTDEVLLRSLVESFLLSLAGASLAIVLAFAWLKWLNGIWIGSIFLAGADVSPSFRVPFRLTPVPALLGFVVSFVVVMSGTLYSSWRAATVSPREAMR
jgi:ABC-type lipoprotein release transport system permease subunit